MEYLYRHKSGLALRRVDLDDVGALLDLKNESWSDTHRISLVSRGSQIQWLAALDTEDIHAPRNLVLVAHRAEVDHCTGVGIFKILDIDWQSRRAAVGWDIFKTFREIGLGKKLVLTGTEFCFEALGLHHLRAEILETNVASQKCAEYAGYQRDGVQKRAIRKGYQWVDNFLYSRLAPE